MRGQLGLPTEGAAKAGVSTAPCTPIPHHPLGCGGCPPPVQTPPAHPIPVPPVGTGTRPQHPSCRVGARSWAHPGSETSPSSPPPPQAPGGSEVPWHPQASPDPFPSPTSSSPPPCSSQLCPGSSRNPLHGKQESKRNLCPGAPSAGTPTAPRAARGTAAALRAPIVLPLPLCPTPALASPSPHSSRGWRDPSQSQTRGFPGVGGGQSGAASLPQPGAGALQRLPPLPSPLGAEGAHRSPSHGVKAPTQIDTGRTAAASPPARAPEQGEPRG